MSSFVSQKASTPSSSRSAFYAPLGFTEHLLTSEEIDDPRAYFESAKKLEAISRHKCAEMQNKAIQALLLKDPEAIEEALLWIDEMDPDPSLPQRNYALQTIVFLQAQTNKTAALETAKKMNDVCSFVVTLGKIPGFVLDTKCVKASFPDADMSLLKILSSISD